MYFSYTKNIELYFNYKIQITFVKATQYKIGLLVNVFQIQYFKLLVFQLLQRCSLAIDFFPPTMK